MKSREENKARDKDRPIIVHRIALLVQQSTHCDDDDAIDAAWNVWDYMGQPDTLNVSPEQLDEARRILRKPPQVDFKSL
jgi:hypothetical protein